MVLGMSLETFTFLHVVISLVGIMTGFIVVALMLSNAPIAGWNAFFLVSTDHLLLLFLGLETLSISSYALACFLKKDVRSSEARKRCS